MSEKSGHPNHKSRLVERLKQFHRDSMGSYVIIAALTAPAVIGAAGLGTEVGVWYYRHHLAQSAADAAAISAATAFGANDKTDVTAQAYGVAGQYGFVNGASAGDTTIVVHQPPTSGPYKSELGAVEVTVQEKRPRLLSALFGNGKITITGHSVAQANAGFGCLLALDGSAVDAGDLQGNPGVNLTNCTAYDNSSNAIALNVGGSASLQALSVSVVGGISGISGITTTKGIITGGSAIADPYAGTSYPSYSGCTYNNLSEHSTVTLNPGVYCNGIKLNANANVTLTSGIYYIDRGGLTVNGGAVLSGNGVTLVFTSSTGSNYATASINGGSTINLTALTTGPTLGIVIFGDRNMPKGTAFSLNGGAGQAFGGAIYLPKAALTYAGGASTNTNCTEVIADTVSFVGNSTLAINCTGYGTKPIGTTTASLVQ